MKTGPDQFDVSVGQEIARLRSGSHRTRNELAKALGVSYQQVQKYETGKSALTFSKMMQIAEFLDVAVLELLPEAERFAADPGLRAKINMETPLDVPKCDMALAQAIADIDDELAKEALIALVTRMSSLKVSE